MKQKIEKLTLDGLMLRFPTEESCEDFIVRSLWPSGVSCPHCKTAGRASRLPSRRRTWFCGACRRQFSILSGTRMPLRTWIKAMFLQATSSKGISAMKIMDWLGVCYDTAWYLERRIDRMMETQAGTILKGAVQVDEKNTAGKPRPDNIPQPLPSAPLFEAAGLVEPPPKRRNTRLLGSLAPSRAMTTAPS